MRSRRMIRLLTTAALCCLSLTGFTAIADEQIIEPTRTMTVLPSSAMGAAQEVGPLPGWVAVGLVVFEQWVESWSDSLEPSAEAGPVSDRSFDSTGTPVLGGVEATGPWPIR